MRLLLDTNILISAALFPRSVSAMAFMKAVTPPYRALVCDYSLDEMRRVFNRKFPHKLAAFDCFFATLALSVEIVSTPDNSHAEDGEDKIRDIKDRPILRAAIHAKVDAILTGDKDFLEAGIEHPKTLSASKFVGNI